MLFCEHCVSKKYDERIHIKYALKILEDYITPEDLKYIEKIINRNISLKNCFLYNH